MEGKQLSSFREGFHCYVIMGFLPGLNLIDYCVKSLMGWQITKD